MFGTPLIDALKAWWNRRFQGGRAIEASNTAEVVALLERLRTRGDATGMAVVRDMATRLGLRLEERKEAAAGRGMADDSGETSQALETCFHSMEKIVQAGERNTVRQLEDYMSILAYINGWDVPAEMHGWPVSPDLGRFLIELIEDRAYVAVVEFGSGVSTVLMAQALKRQRSRAEAPARQLAFEHLARYHGQTGAWLRRASLADRVRLVHVPLEDRRMDDGIYPFYACDTELRHLFAELGPQEGPILVLVDGPPGATRPQARYPAVPVMLAHLGGRTMDVVLDDYHRDDEQHIVQRWRSDIQASGRACAVTALKMEKGACKLTVTPVPLGG